jgi:eukaryotic-like serine/threonine-protein kinase
MDLPERLGRLRVLGPLGSGAFATVWHALDPDLDCPVAVKVLADNWARRADVRERFLTEARLLRRVDSDRVVRVYDVGTLDDGRPYLVMTYADGGSLGDRLAAGPLPAAEALAVLDQVAEGLDALHAKGIVHRDVNPHNVLLLDQPAPDGLPGRRVLLADLGIAKDLQWASGLTQPAGTGDYRAPEQRQYSADVGPASDVYALAMLARTLLDHSPLDHSLLDQSLPPAAESVLAGATDESPASRPPRASDLVRDLRWALAPPPAPASAAEPTAESAAEPTAESTATTNREGRSRRRIVVACLGTAVAVLAVGGGLARDRQRRATYASADGVVSVRLRPGWDTPDVPPTVPGASARSSGVVAIRDERRVQVAVTGQRLAPATVAAAVRHGPCGRVAVQAVAAGDLTGTALAWTGCPDGLQYLEIGLRSARETVYVAVASPDERPSAQDVLGNLEVRW